MNWSSLHYSFNSNVVNLYPINDLTVA